MRDYKPSLLESVLFLPHFNPLLHEWCFESSIQHRWKEDKASLIQWMCKFGSQWLAGIRWAKILKSRQPPDSQTRIKKVGQEERKKEKEGRKERGRERKKCKNSPRQNVYKDINARDKIKKISMYSSCFGDCLFVCFHSEFLGLA